MVRRQWNTCYARRKKIHVYVKYYSGMKAKKRYSQMKEN